MRTEASRSGVRLDGFREPRQERSRRTLDRIAGATEAILSRRGSGELRVQDVVARADTSVGAFYARFDSKEVAVAFVRERSWDEARRLWRRFLDPEAWRNVPAPALVAEVIRRFGRILLAEERPSRALYLDLLRREDEDGLERLRALDRDIADLMGRLLEARTARSGVQVDGRAAREGFLRVVSAVRDHLLFGGGENDRSLLLRLTQMYAALLDLEAPATWDELLTTCAGARRQRAGLDAREGAGKPGRP